MLMNTCGLQGRSDGVSAGFASATQDAGTLAPVDDDYIGYCNCRGCR